jgi:hypothetical protein
LWILGRLTGDRLCPLALIVSTRGLVSAFLWLLLLLLELAVIPGTKDGEAVDWFGGLPKAIPSLLM